MRIYVTDRQRGKTTKALQEAFKVSTEPTAFVTFSTHTANILRTEFARKLRASKLEIFSVQEFRFIGELRRYKHVYIDDAEQILYSLVQGSLADDGAIRLVTMTGLPVRDLALVRAGAAQIWREAADMIEKIPASFQALAKLRDQFLERAVSLEKAQGGADEIRDRSDAGTEARPIQPTDPVVHEGELQPRHGDRG